MAISGKGYTGKPDIGGHEFPSQDLEGWRAAPGWFDLADLPFRPSGTPLGRGGIKTGPIRFALSDDRLAKFNLMTNYSLNSYSPFPYFCQEDLPACSVFFSTRKR